MSMMLLLEAAGRVLVMGALIGFALRVLNIQQVRAQRIAWLLALAGALFMPVLVGLQVGPRVLPAHTQQTGAGGTPQLLHGAAASEPDGAGAAGVAGSLQSAGTDVSTRSMAVTRGGVAGVLAKHAATWASVVYFAVAGLLMLRLAVGVSVAARIRRQAARVDDSQLLGTDQERHVDVRVSARLRAPVTIGSSILLPQGYTAWPQDTLRIVLSHETAHVRHADFYVQLLAGLHCALFWFSPFSWWVRRQLADLAEALSDHAAVRHAPNRASYAEILLAFASGSGPAAGVAMARTSNLTSRIERLLSERVFQQCFTGRRRAMFIAGAVAAAALIAATSVARVQAATHGFVTSDEAFSGDQAYSGNTGYSDSVSPPAPPPPVESRQPAAPKKPALPPAPHAPAVPAPAPPPPVPAAQGLSGHDGEPSAVVGDTIYFHYHGRGYVVRIPDFARMPSLGGQADALLVPMRELARARQDLARESETLAREHMDWRAEQPEAAPPTPDFNRDIEELNQVVSEMKLAQATPQIRAESLAELQGKLARIEAGLAAAEGHAAMRRENAQLRAFSEQQAQLGREMERLSEQQKKLVEHTMMQLRPLLEKAVRDGLAAPAG